MARFITPLAVAKLVLLSGYATKVEIYESGLYVFNPEGRSMPPYNGPRRLKAGIDGGIVSLKSDYVLGRRDADIQCWKDRG